MHTTTSALFAALSIFACGATAEAQEFTLGSATTTYPRMIDSTRIDPNTYVFGPAASVRTHAGHANYDHPAVASHDTPSEIDFNTFILRHPTGAGPATTDAVVGVVAANH